MEIKKYDENKSSKIFDSKSHGVGQMHTQLVLSSSRLRGPAFAAISTFNELRIYSNKPFKEPLSLLQPGYVAKASEATNRSDSIEHKSPERMPGVAEKIKFPPEQSATTKNPFHATQ